MKNKKISLEFNELTLDWINFYIKKGKLKNFSRFFEQNSLKTTTSEVNYKNLEPWIQWPSFYLSKSYDEHKLFNLGDCENSNQTTIYDSYQEQGDVCALSPMNCVFKKNKSSIFLPDPWATHEFKNSNKLDNLWKSVSKFVNNNGAGSIGILDIYRLLVGFLRFAKFSNMYHYCYFAFGSIKYKWRRAIFLDLLLSDILINLIEKKKGGYTYISAFFNAAAHIQHHHLYDSSYYSGNNKNEESYSLASVTKVDPLLEIYEVYDKILEKLLNIEGYKIYITTGLQQIENKEPYNQYRPINHKLFFKILNINAKEITPKMSRDMSLSFFNIKDYDNAMNILKSLRTSKDMLFNIDEDHENLEIFLKIKWIGNKGEFKKVFYLEDTIDLYEHVEMISCENSIHTSNGWHAGIDCKDSEIPIWDLAKLIYAD